MRARNTVDIIASIVGAVIIAAAISALLFSIASFLGFYSKDLSPLVYSIVSLAVIPVLRRNVPKKPILSLLTAFSIPILFLSGVEWLKLVASVLLGYLAASSLKDS
ncbi:hypothetical protein [Archaeoglobus fulgidus]|nr:hypothetical protein [Archaeoglobus fulgidus]